MLHRDQGGHQLQLRLDHWSVVVLGDGVPMVVLVLVVDLVVIFNSTENFGRKMEIYKNGECLTSDTFKVEHIA